MSGAMQDCRMCGTAKPVNCYCTCPYGRAVENWATHELRADRAERERDDLAEKLRLRSEALNRVAAENDRLRATVARVEAVLSDISAPNPEADQDWHDDPIGCVADDLRAALAGGGGS